MKGRNFVTSVFRASSFSLMATGVLVAGFFATASAVLKVSKSPDHSINSCGLIPQFIAFNVTVS
jgi:hypothetical protein